MLGSATSHSRLFWSLQIGGWLALVPVFVGMNVLIGLAPELALLNGFFRQAVGFLLTLVLWRIYRRWSWKDFSPWPHGVFLVGLVGAATLADLALFELLRPTLRLDYGGTPTLLFQAGASVARFVLYAGWSGLYLSLRQFLDIRDRDLRLARAEIATREVELQVLRAQLNPHFLFNALNSILAEADDNPARVKAITLSLSELLRFSLRQRDHFGPLGDEIIAIENYLRVERSRFEERLDWRIDVAPEVRAMRVPAALLLPLVENAIKYGLQTSPTHLQLRVGAEVRDGGIVAFVENSGHWIEPDLTATRSTGIGLANLRRRLALLCGPRAQVEISFPPGLVRVEIQVPPVTPSP